jgi:hypothetical protein
VEKFLLFSKLREEVPVSEAVGFAHESDSFGLEEGELSCVWGEFFAEVSALKFMVPSILIFLNPH